MGTEIQDKKEGDMRKSPRRLMVYAHFSRSGTPAEYVLNGCKAYRPYAADLLFVSSSPIDTQTRHQFSAVCDEVIQRENAGYDFCSWKEALKTIDDLGAYDEIILTNDSVIGPLSDPGPALRRLSAHGDPVCGLTLNWQYGRHAQSYFIRYRSDVVSSGAFLEFWEQVTALERKLDIVLSYEVGLTKFMEARGHSVGALLALPELNPLINRIPLCLRAARWQEPLRTALAWRHLLREPRTNPVHHLWRELLDDGLPFVKKELLRDNPLYANRRAVLAEISKRYEIPPDIMLEYANA